MAIKISNMKTLFNIVIFFFIFSIVSCKKYADDYKDYLENREVVYPGLARNVRYHAGNLRTVLVWNPSPDPGIRKYTVLWNNGMDSLSVNAATHDPADSIVVSIPNLQEYVYSFRIIAYDDEGHASVGQELNNVRVYGPAFQSTLLNRPYNPANPYQFNPDGKLQLNFNKADTNNVHTTIRYTNTSDETKEVLLHANVNSLILPDYKKGTTVQYRSAYIPSSGAADVFNVLNFDDFPEIPVIVECNKSLFKPMSLPGDIGSAWGWELPFIWNNNTGEPGFHTPDKNFPVWFTIDLGEQASLTDLKVWQRMSALYNYGNPKRFEIWGSNNPASDGSWDSWAKLGDFTTVKPSGSPVGQNTDLDRTTAEGGDPYKFSQPTQSVRYIRFKVLETWGGTNYFHIVELSFFKKG